MFHLAWKKLLLGNCKEGKLCADLWQAEGFDNKMGAETDLDIVKTYLSKLRRVSILYLILFYLTI